MKILKVKIRVPCALCSFSQFYISTEQILFGLFIFNGFLVYKLPHSVKHLQTRKVTASESSLRP